MSRELAAEFVPLSQLKPWADNPRLNLRAIDKVIASIKRFGFGAPLLARKANGEIIAGHTRYEAAKRMGLREVPVRFMDLDPVEAHLLALADNKTNEIATWDDDKLVAIIQSLKAQGVDVLSGTGYESAEIDKILKEQELKSEFDEYDSSFGTSGKQCPHCGGAL